MKTLFSICLLVLMTSVANAHEGHSHAPTPKTKKKIIRVNTESPKQHFVMFNNAAIAAKPKLATLFEPFKKTVNVRFDKDYLFVESNGMPAHLMMTGITAWQQQVPLPQSYTGGNAWRIPLHPVPSKNPMSTKSNFFRGAIALAANGVPIFNPIKNDGRTDTLQAGELDQWGGHCGRADDYHYHIAPVHLEKIVGVGNPVAVALDGYSIYGYNDPNGKPPTNLDWLNGHKGPDGVYHYHATKTFPYLNGGFYGEVSERNGQVDPQPRAQPVRPSLPPLRGAKITDFKNPKPNSYVVVYDVNGDKRSVDYTIADNGWATFKFVSQQGTTTETYTRQQRGRRGDERGRNEQSGAREQRPPRGDQPGMERGDQRRGGQQGQGGGGGDPIFRALDSNRNGILEKTEIQNAAKTLLTLDKNNDGKITNDELRGPGGGRGQDERRQGERGQRGRPQDDRQQGGRPQDGRRQGNGSADQASGPRGPQSGDGPRQPWIVVHADEIDLDKNKIISRDEIVGEATKAFVGYDTNSDGKLSSSELNAGNRSRSAMGGYLKRHSDELDRDGDGIVTRAEAVGNSERMFARMDSNGDGNISAEEMKASRRE